MSSRYLTRIKNEIDMLKKVDHPNIVKYFETYENDSFLYLVMELCTGGVIFDVHCKEIESQIYSEE